MTVLGRDLRATTSSNVIGEIKELAALRNQGVLSLEEFQSAKQAPLRKL